MGSCAGRVALVVGSGELGGIGAASARALADEGADVVLADLDGEKAAARAAEINTAGGTAEGIAIDLNDIATVDAAFRWIVDNRGGLDILHNNAAAIHLTKFDVELCELPLDVWEETMRVNLRGPMLCMQRAIPLMRERGGGSIVNTTSVMGHTGALRLTAYGPSKAGLAMLTKYVATQYARFGIRCNAVAPSSTVTPTTRTGNEHRAAMVASHHLLGRPGLPEEVARAVVFLASDDASFITGEEIHVAGGFLVHTPTFADELVQL